MRRAFSLGMLVACILCMLSTAEAWDKEHKGFVLGLGGGFGAGTFKQTVTAGPLSAESDRESKGAFFTDFEIGYAPSNQIAILYSNVVTWFRIKNVYEQDVTIVSGISAVTVNYFFGAQAPAFFIGAGPGIAVWDTPFENGSSAWTSAGIMGRVGYEFAHGFGVVGHILYGKPSNSDFGIEAETEAVNFGLTINWMGY